MNGSYVIEGLEGEKCLDRLFGGCPSDGGALVRPTDISDPGGTARGEIRVSCSLRRAGSDGD